MRNWINKTKTVITTVALFLALLGSGAETINQGREISIQESVRLTQYEPESIDSSGGAEWEETGENTGLTQYTEEELGYATEFKDEEILYSSYYSYGEGCFSVELVKEDLDVTTKGAIATSMSNSGIVSSQQLLDACLSEAEKAELEAGVNKEIRVVMKQMVVEGLTDKQYDLMEQATEEYTKTYSGFQTGSYIKINITKKNEEGKWKKIKELNNDIKIYIDVPKISQISEAKEFYLLQIRNNEYSIVEDEDNYLETMTVSVSGSAMCAIGYTLPVVEITPTVVPTSQPTYWGQMTSGDFCVWHWFDISILVIGITWLLAVDSKKIRIVFLAVMSIICIILAIMGRCVYDWPLSAGCIVLMILVHMGKTYYKRHKKRK